MDLQLRSEAFTIVLLVGFTIGCAEPTVPPVASSSSTPNAASTTANSAQEQPAAPTNSRDGSRVQEQPAAPTNSSRVSQPLVAPTSPIAPKIELPSDYPKDVSIIDGATQVGLESKDGATKLSLSCASTIPQVIEYYRHAMTENGWEGFRQIKIDGPLYYAAYAVAIAHKPARMVRIEAFKTRGPGENDTKITVTVEDETSLPEDIPHYPGAVFEGSFFQRTSALYWSPDPPTTVLQHYENALPKLGWAFVGHYQQNVPPPGVFLSALFDKGDRRLHLEVRSGPDEMEQLESGETRITIEQMPKPKS